MDHEAICDCPFRDGCQTFSDPLVDDRRKGPDGLGCARQNDVYRGEHCRTFRCAVLSMVVSDVLHHARPAPAGPKA